MRWWSGPGWSGSRLRAPWRVSGSQRGGAGAGGPHRFGNVFAQQRGDPCRALLSHGSLKARLCVEGRKALYDYCERHGVALQALRQAGGGRDDSEMAEPCARWRKRAPTMAWSDLRLAFGAEARALEPAVACVGAILFALERHFRQPRLYAGACAATPRVLARFFAFNTPFVRARVEDDGFARGRPAAPSRCDVKARALVNCAGLDASRVARAIEGSTPRRFRRPATPRAIISRWRDARRSNA